ncbi:MAG: helix-turn-helix transcriptional regulator [Haliscomenobacter sp.]|nr:helix-turn-helix transcriptional regulator [Haliscomenobacter sp.]
MVYQTPKMESLRSKKKFKQQIEEVVFETLEYPKRYAHDERIVACKRLINQKIHQPKIKLADLAQEVCLSPSRLSHLFREQMGMPIRSFIIWERMKIAIHDLLQNDLNLTEAAYSAGFYDVAHFTKNFKELFGVTPSVVYNNSRIVQA